MVKFYTAEERHRIYKQMLALMDDPKYPPPYFLCLMLRFVTGEENPEVFPELIAHKPGGIVWPRTYWFHSDEQGDKRRRQILEQCMKELEHCIKETE